MRGEISEELRQMREAFDQNKKQAQRWFTLRLTMGYTAVGLLAGVALLCAVVVVNGMAFRPSVTHAALGLLGGDLLAVLAAVWKLVLNPISAGSLKLTILPREGRLSRTSRIG